MSIETELKKLSKKIPAKDWDKTREIMIPLSLLEKVYRGVYYDVADLIQIVYPSPERQIGARTSIQVLLGTLYGEMEKQKLITHDEYMESVKRIYNRKGKK